MIFCWQLTDDEDTGDISIDNFGVPVMSRLLGWEDQKGYTDFVLAKGTSCVDLDQLIGLVEIKKNHHLIAVRDLQMARYLKSAASKPQSAATLHGFLIMGSLMHVYQLQSHEFDSKWDVIGDISTLDSQLERYLRTIAIAEY